MRFVKYLIILFLLLFSTTAFSQRFVRDDAGQIYFIDSTSADTVKIDVTGAVFKIVNTGATFEMTTMTTAQRDALTASNGMIINNSSDNQIQGYANGAWVNLGSGGLSAISAWEILLNNSGSSAVPTGVKISALTDRAAFGSGDKLMIEESTGELRKIDFSDLPGAGGGISNIVEDTTPQLGGDLDANTFDIQFDDGDGIHDDSDNEQLLFSKTASAINHLEIGNASIGLHPSLTAIGTDTDINLTLDGQGTGTVRTLSSNLDITGNIIVSGTVDGKDIAANAGMLNEAETISSNWVNTANPWAVDEGGSGAATFTDGGVLLGSGTGAFTPMAVLSDGEFIVGDGTTDPVAESGATLRTSIGVGTGDSPEFSGVVANLYDASGAVDLDIGSGDVLDVTVTTDGGVIVLDGNITQDAGTTLFMGGLLDATGAVDMDYGSGDITDHTFSTDGTGTAEIVLPAGSIDGTEILDGTIATADINASAGITMAQTALVAGTNISLSTNTLNVDDAFLVNDAADEMLLADATTNVVTDILDLSHTGGTVAAGFGTGIRFDIEDAGGIEEQASIDVSLDVVTDGAEEASIIFRHNVAGTIQESMRIDGTSGSVGIGTSTPDHTLEIQGHVGIIRTATIADQHALEITADAAGFGDFKGLEISYDTGALSAGEVSAVILIDINEIDAGGGDVIGLEILSTDGGADNIVGIKVGAVVAPLLQDSGVFANPTLATNNTNTTNVPDMVDGSTGTNTTIFAADNDFIIIGADAAFTQIEFVIETGFGNPGIQAVFAFSTSGTNQFTNFTPTDGTDGFKNAGAFVVAWDADEVPNHVADDVTGKFDIRITRTANPAGSVSLFYAKSALTRTFAIDKNGNVRFLTYAFEGATDDAFEHTLNVIDPTADRLLNFPDDQVVAGDVFVGSGNSNLAYLNLATTEILIGDGSGVPTAASLSSGSTMTNSGVVTNIDITITDNESTAEENPIVFVAGADPDGGAHIGLETDGTATYNPSTGTITTTEFVGGGVGITGVTASHSGTITWSGTSILESGAAFQFGDASDATLTHTYANTGTNVTVAYSNAAMGITGALTATSFGGITEANLVDKSASETMTGNWIFNSNLSIGNAATSSGVLTILEDTDAGSNFASFQVPALASNTAYILPPAFGSSGQQLTDAAGDGVLSWAAVGSGTGAFSDAGDPVVLNTTTKNVEIGDTGVSLDAKVQIAGDTDEVQLIIEGHSPQTDDIFIIQQDDETQVFTVSNAGVVTMATDLAVTEGGTGASTLTDGGPLLGSGTGAITAMAVLADGEFIVGDGTTDPVAESGATLRTSIGVSGTGVQELFVQSGKLNGGFITAGAGIDAGDGNWRALFDASTTESMLWQFRLPTGFSSGLTAKIQYSMTSATADKVDWEIDVMAVADGEDPNSASFATTNEVSGGTTVPGTAGFLDSISITLSNDDSIAAGELCIIRINRDHDDADDTATGDAELVSLTIEWTE